MNIRRRIGDQSCKMIVHATIMLVVCRILPALLIALAVTLPARAQISPHLPAEPMDALMRAGLDAKYGRALTGAFAASVRRNGDPACLRAKALDDAALAERGRELFQRYGSRSLETLMDNFNRSAFDSALSAQAGPDAAAELERLQRDPDVKKLTELYRPARLAKLLDYVVGQFDRYVLINRIKLDPVSPLASGDAALLRANPTEASEAAAGRFAAGRRSRGFDRYAVLADASEASMKKAFAPDAGLKLAPTVVMRGVENDLGELCVGRR